MIGFAVLAVGLGAAAVAYVGYLGLVGRLRRNWWAGIRTSYTMQNDEVWYRTHRAAGPVMLLGGVAVAAVALAFTPFAFAGAIGTTGGAAIAVACAALLAVFAVASWFVGARTASRELRS